MATLKEYYEDTCRPQLQEKFAFTNNMEIPRIEKIVLNMGPGEAVQNPKVVDNAANELTMIAGQKAVVTRAKKSIATFKLRSGMPIGCRVTLRHDRMYDFLSRLINIALPRVRDFRGISAKGFDGRGNYSLGIKEQIIFPEIDVDKVTRIFGMDITIVTSAKTDEEAKALLEGFGMPATRPEQAPKRYARWMDELKTTPHWRPYANYAELADRMQKNNARLTRERAEFLARHWGREAEGGGVVLRSDPAHKLVNATLYRLDEAQACWALQSPSTRSPET